MPRCGGGLQAVATAAMMVQSGAADVVIAGGVESMSNIECYSTDMRWGARRQRAFYDRLERGRERSRPVERFGKISGMIETAENLARDWGIAREEADAYAARSHARAAAAWAAGRFDAEVVAVQAPQRKGDPVTFARDEGLCPGAPASLPKAWPAARADARRHRDGRQQNDASAACLIVAEDKLAELGLTPMVTVVGWAAAGCEPSHMGIGIGPVPAVKKLLARLGLTLDQMDLVELNGAFACQVLAVPEGWDWQD